MKWFFDRHRRHRRQHKLKAAEGFTLTELLVVMAIVGVLAALLLPVLALAKARAQTTGCENRLRQMGIALAMYASETQHYPSLIERSQATNVRAENQTWADEIYPYLGIRWTNQSWQCPRYLAQHGIIIPAPPMLDVFSSYAYNYHGIVGEGGGSSSPLTLGLGAVPKTAAMDSQVAAPSEMFAVSDSRWWLYHSQVETGIAGKWNMSPWKYVYNLTNPTRQVVHVETAAPHGPGYNILFVEGHVASVKRSDFLYPPRTAHNWNRDNQPHPEVWAPKSDWVVQQ